MFQTHFHISKTKFKQNAPAFGNDQMSLPLIQNRISLSEERSNRKSTTEKQKIMFPDIQNTEGNFEAQTENDLDKENIQQLNKSSFARQVQEKLNLVLGQIPQYEQQSDNDIDSEDMDFEAKINENKKIIQQNRLKKENKNNEVPKNKMTLQSQQYWERKKKNESLYQKRAKQYKGQSVENKYLVKRKQTMNQKIISSQPGKRKQNTQRERKFAGKQQKNHNRAMSHKGSIKSLVGNEIYKNESLYDGIQNYLQNPRQNKKPEEQKFVGLNLLKVKREIEDKIKDINQRLGLQEEIQKDKQKCLNITAGGWRRVEINNLNSHYSNFEAQLQRVGSLQERNSYYLEQYLENQKMLIGINLERKS